MIEEILFEIVAGDAPVFLLIAGPNGAGKSTFREKRLNRISFPCIDPDQVGKELLSRHPSTKEEALNATQEATDRIRRFLNQSKSVALETVFSDSQGHKLALIEEARKKGFKTVLIFIGVDDPEISIARVMDRVDHGGHDVPDQIIKNRFPKCFENLKKALPIVDLAIFVDNTGSYGLMDSRHYIFGFARKGDPPELSDPLPHWFINFRISDAIQNDNPSDIR
jgi:predicted ABC-type ATPase